MRSQKTFPKMIDLNYVYDILKRKQFYDTEISYRQMKKFIMLPLKEKSICLDIIIDSGRRLFPHYLEKANKNQINRYYSNLLSDQNRIKIDKLPISWVEILFMPKNMQHQYLKEIIYGKRKKPKDETIPIFAFFDISAIHEYIDELISKNMMIPLTLLVLGTSSQKNAYLSRRPEKFTESEIADIMNKIYITEFDPKKISWKIY